MLITEKVGPVWLVSQQGEKTVVGNTPPSLLAGPERHAGRLPLAHVRDRPAASISPMSSRVTTAAAWRSARAKLNATAAAARLEKFEVLWRQLPRGKGGQEGGQIAFSPDGKYLFLTVGDRQRFTPAQDPDQPVGKILRLTLDGKPAPGNPNSARPAPPPFP